MLKTGDLLLFEPDTFYGCCVSCATQSNISHVGMVLRDPTYIKPEFKGLYVIESLLDNQYDIVTHEVRNGIHVHKLVDVVQSCSVGSVYCRRLNINLSIADIDKKMTDIYNSLRNDKYELDITAWLSNITGIAITTDDVKRDQSYTCSALCAFIYSKLNVAEYANVNWSFIKPVDFTCSLDCFGKTRAVKVI